MSELAPLCTCDRERMRGPRHAHTCAVYQSWSHRDVAEPQRSALVAAALVQAKRRRLEERGEVGA